MDEGSTQDSAAVADAWREEVRRRSLEIRSRAVRPVPLADVLADVERILAAQD